MTKRELEELVKKQAAQIDALIALLKKEKSRPVIEIKQGEKQYYPTIEVPATYPAAPLDWPPFIKWIVEPSQTTNTTTKM